MDCGSIGCGFESRFLPLSLLSFFWFWVLAFLTTLSRSLSAFLTTIVCAVFPQIQFLTKFYHTNDLIWQEGLLVDFLQKKIVDNWVKRFLIRSSYLFNERFAFEKVTNFFLTALIWPMHTYFFFETRTIASLFWLNIFIFVGIFTIFSFFFFVFA